MKYPETLNNLIECLKKLPTIGEKSAVRLALHILKEDDKFLEIFSKTINEVKSKTLKCTKCNNFTENDTCVICESKDRKKEIICIVEEPKNIIVFENIGSYSGMYHVINGLISPVDGRNPEDLNLIQLINRVKDEKIEEVIIALTPSLEGETTALYITELLKPFKIKVSKIAHGIPLGADMDYIDPLTLELALSSRKEITY